MEVDYTAQLKGSLKLSSDGVWLHEGVAFTNPQLSSLFHRSVVWDESEQSYFVKIGRQRASFDCEDTAFFVAELLDRGLPWQIRLLSGVVENLNAKSLSIGTQNQFYCTVTNGHLARFTRTAHQALIAYAQAEDSLSIGGQLVKIRAR